MKRACTPKCRICKDRHFLKHCPAFQGMSVVRRREVIREKGFCFNCLCTAHTRNWCPSRNKCMVCQLNHHTMVHVDQSSTPKATLQHMHQHSQNTTRKIEKNGRSCNSRKPNSTQHRAKSKAQDQEPHLHFRERLSHRTRQHVFLPTLLARIPTPDGPAKTRILMNSGEVQTMILQTLVERLHLRTTRKDNKEYCTLNLESYQDPLAKIQIIGMVQKKFRTTLPKPISEPKLRAIYDHITDLADPNFHNPCNVEILLANDQIPRILRAGMIQTSSSMPIAQSTIFGWTISGACRY
ncbi:uncharacterized protein LOC131997830 isoform X3 [Stomoxys calcitrans]|uniref:uncharacterized protein LOC131994349 isoform X3 n=1 Tax=Stomoxys calcitrans TaxID=35570 RepID=UPI0027E3470C|nr:uncharacterized protein LOC131994349 isoform X3 [Stomoxys calcitrans]XP_059217903.1 uncharacterized protein LOC131994883 isoform X3 [Stomoxys calcitrans]XP_059225559.1 uncharacterized protein LOC131997830 isoform X3 [Stomoxys calcitrans]